MFLAGILNRPFFAGAGVPFHLNRADRIYSPVQAHFDQFSC